jgi:hypothetical protein
VINVDLVADRQTDDRSLMSQCCFLESSLLVDRFLGRMRIHLGRDVLTHSTPKFQKFDLTGTSHLNQERLEWSLALAQQQQDNSLSLWRLTVLLSPKSNKGWI